MDDIENNPIPTYQTYLLKHLTKVYIARKETVRTDWTRYSDLLIDKFAIHSSTLYHLFNGIIERPSSDLNARTTSFDLFSVNSIIRVLIETYIAFNHIFVSASSESEKEFRFLLWQLDGLLEQKKFRVDNSDFDEVESILNENKSRIENLFVQIENNIFYKSLPEEQSLKIFNKKEKKYNWKYKITDGLIIRPLQIIELVEMTCVARIFVNSYRYTSIHTHTGFISIEHFEKMRGKEVSDDYINPLATQSIILTIFLINDICSIDANAQNVFLTFANKDRENIIGINTVCRKV